MSLPLAMHDFARQRLHMVRTQIESRGIRDPRLLRALRDVPRERFVDPLLAASAYDDTPLPIGEGQTISQPYIVAAMLAAAAIGPADKVLEIGAGSGYAAALLGRLASTVWAVERLPGLATAARRRLDGCGVRNVSVRTGDGTLGWPDMAPFDAILVAAAGPSVPPALKMQLAIGGRLVMPVGQTPWRQRLVKVTRSSATDFGHEALEAVSFVPLIGEQGFAVDPDTP